MESFREVLEQFDSEELIRYINDADREMVEAAIAKEYLGQMEFAALLSPMAEGFLDTMLKRSKYLTMRHFGKTIQMYTPIYISNYCDNECLYCGFRHSTKINRKHLTVQEIEKEADSIVAGGHRQILLLTGESRSRSSVAYIAAAVEILKCRFDSIGIEIYPLNQDEYMIIRQRGADSLTIYQETYSAPHYDLLHLSGPKKNFQFRLDAPERACRAGFRGVGIGALLGLHDWRSDAFFTGLHAAYLQQKYPDVEIGVSVPRIRPCAGGVQPASIVGRKQLLQIILALRLFLPQARMSLSTREAADFRDSMIGYGITSMSAGVSTQVGERTSHEPGEGQFDTADKRSVREIDAMIREKGFQPVYKDWSRELGGWQS